MRFLIISHVEHKKQDNLLYAYAPYVREMNLWLKHVDEVEVIAPLITKPTSKIDMAYKHDKLFLNIIPAIEFTSFSKIIISILKIPIILLTIFKACKKADHIHLRCPGNIGLLGCLVQILFPKKTKTAKYAGNWDPKAKQPLSYKFQKWLLRNTFLTKKIHVLVYGDWKNQSKNIKSFFTATFKEEEKKLPEARNYTSDLRFVFVGTLVKGKRPLFAVKIIEGLLVEGYNIKLDIYGDGILKGELNKYIKYNKLEKFITLHGNQDIQVLKKALKKAHFLILASKSEGWPKAIAEAMFFGLIPISTKISCVPYMLDYGKRGILINSNLKEALEEIKKYLKNETLLKSMSKLGANWSQNFTLETFEKEIAKLLKH
ncbi:glycosyl transferase [Flavivirga aquatica]|uniref:Glycosyl transferase n=1 Tax=Flavivirga aquatica TaxID=1849968 RepID=A0A1E5TBX4_9FLAO|nr:glycosyltransferase [Flavivirga aquatica]OEK08861.1 glycosyl transferase [Flavivirga aquatica]